MVSDINILKNWNHVFQSHDLSMLGRLIKVFMLFRFQSDQKRENLCSRTPVHLIWELYSRINFNKPWACILAPLFFHKYVSLQGPWPPWPPLPRRDCAWTACGFVVIRKNYAKTLLADSLTFRNKTPDGKVTLGQVSAMRFQNLSCSVTSIT